MEFGQEEGVVDESENDEPDVVGQIRQKGRGIGHPPLNESGAFSDQKTQNRKIVVLFS